MLSKKNKVSTPTFSLFSNIFLEVELSKNQILTREQIAHRDFLIERKKAQSRRIAKAKTINPKKIDKA